MGKTIKLYEVAVAKQEKRKLKQFIKTRREAREAKELVTTEWRKPIFEYEAPLKVKKEKPVTNYIPLHPNKGTCPICKAEGVKLTKDHIVPQWAYKRIPLLTKGLMRACKKDLGVANIQYICQPCNGKKGGRMDVSHPIGMAFWKKVRDEIDKVIKANEEKPQSDS